MNATLIQRSMQIVIVAVILLVAGVWVSFIPGHSYAYSVVLHDPDEIPFSPGEPWSGKRPEETPSIKLPGSFMDQAFANPPASWQALAEAERAKRIAWMEARVGATENSLRRFLKQPANGLTIDERKRLAQELDRRVTARLDDSFCLPMSCFGCIASGSKMSREARIQAWVGSLVVIGGTALLGALQTLKFKKAHQQLCVKYGM